MDNKHKLYEQIRRSNVKTVLDIGANVGQFAMEIKANFPHLFVVSIEPNRDCEPYLKSYGLNYIICCPSDRKTTKKFYRTKNNRVGTGFSLSKKIPVIMMEII